MPKNYFKDWITSYKSFCKKINIKDFSNCIDSIYYHKCKKNPYTKQNHCCKCICVGSSGADGATASADGATGPAGADGATGPAGADGATGPAGT